MNRLFLLLLLVVITFAGCTKENLSDCGIEVMFKYDNNIHQTDKFPTDIDKIDLFVFDAGGTFVAEYFDSGSHLDNRYKMRLTDLKPGIYDLVAWGNLRDDFDVTPLIKGVSKMSDAKLSLKRDRQGEVSRRFEPLYHGTTTRIEVKGGKSDIVLISMIKNTNFIKVTAKGLPIDGTRAAAPGTQFSCRISG